MKFIMKSQSDPDSKIGTLLHRLARRRRELSRRPLLHERKAHNSATSGSASNLALPTQAGSDNESVEILGGSGREEGEEGEDKFEANNPSDIVDDQSQADEPPPSKK